MTQAAVLIGDYPVGPTCAKKAGLLTRRAAGLVRFVTVPKRDKTQDPKTLDLFDGVAA